MKSCLNVARIPKSPYRELSDKELNEIMRAVGDRVRAQSIEQRERLNADLKQELSATRAAYMANERQRTKA